MSRAVGSSGRLLKWLGPLSLLALPLLAAVWALGAAAFLPVLLALWAGAGLLGLIAAAETLLRVFTKPLAVVVGVTVGILTVIYVVVAAAVLRGFWDIAPIESELRDLHERSRAIELLDSSGRPLGILPSGLLSGSAPYAAVHLRPDQIPPVFSACLRHLEDRGRPWQVVGIDPLALIRAFAANLRGKRQGGSTLSEMVQRALRGTPPRPSASFADEFPRKWAAWREGPALARLFPTSPEVLAAAATHIAFAKGAPGSRFGGDLHGLALTAMAVFGKTLDINPAEQAFLAAAAQSPLILGAPPSDAAAREQVEKIRARADRCLRDGAFRHDFDREHARRELASLEIPTDAVHPARRGRDLLGGATNEIVRTLEREIGDDWPTRVAKVRLSVRADMAGLAESIAGEAHKVEQHLQDRLWMPLWDGIGTHALVIGIVADAEGQPIAVVTNTELDIGSSALPIGSVAKVPAVLAIGAHEVPTQRARAAIARSDSRWVRQKLSSIPEAEIVRAFEALGWTVPPGASAHKLAVNGAIEVAPLTVLRGINLLNRRLFSLPSQPVPLPGIVTEVELVDGTHILPSRAMLRPELLGRIAGPAASDYARDVLRAPIRSGTMRGLWPAFQAAGIEQFWGKTGTADAAAGGRGIAPTRAIWQVGGFEYQGKAYSFVMVVASPDVRRPLGYVQSPSITPLTLELIRKNVLRM